MLFHPLHRALHILRITGSSAGGRGLGRGLLLYLRRRASISCIELWRTHHTRIQWEHPRLARRHCTSCSSALHAPIPLRALEHHLAVVSCTGVTSNLWFRPTATLKHCYILLSSQQPLLSYYLTGAHLSLYYLLDSYGFRTPLRSGRACQTITNVLLEAQDQPQHAPGYGPGTIVPRTSSNVARQHPTL